MCPSIWAISPTPIHLTLNLFDSIWDYAFILLLHITLAYFLVSLKNNASSLEKYLFYINHIF